MALRPHGVVRRREGQLLSVSLSSAGAEIGEPLATLRERYLPALQRLLPEARAAEVLDFTVDARAARHLPRDTWNRAAAPGHADVAPGPLPRRRVDRHRLARDDGRRGAQRSRRRNGGARGSRAGTHEKRAAA